MWDKHKKAAALGFIVLCLLGLAAFTRESYAAGPFGGRITNLFRCVNGLLLTVSPPRGGKFMYVPGSSFSYSYGPPKRVGQWLLGMSGGATPCLVPCKTGLCVHGFAPLIIFHGSSM